MKKYGEIIFAFLTLVAVFGASRPAYAAPNLCPQRQGAVECAPSYFMGGGCEDAALVNGWAASCTGAGIGLNCAYNGQNPSVPKCVCTGGYEQNPFWDQGDNNPPQCRASCASGLLYCTPGNPDNRTDASAPASCVPLDYGPAAGITPSADGASCPSTGKGVANYCTGLCTSCSGGRVSFGGACVFPSTLVYDSLSTSFFGSVTSEVWEEISGVWKKSGNNIYNSNTGNVGIGTTPSYKLHVIDTGNTGLRVQTDAAGGTVASYGGNGDFVIDAPGIVGGRLTVKESGNVGIGTSKPNGKFNVPGGPANPRFGFCQLGAVWYDENGSGGIDNGECKWPGLGVDSAGRVGIGTASPNRRLQVNGDPLNSATEFSINDNLFLDGQGSTVRLTNNAYLTGNTWTIRDSAAKAFTAEFRDTGVLDFYGTLTNGVDDWRQMASFDAPGNKVVFPSGNVGIGTAIPGAKLEVAGQIYASGGAPGLTPTPMLKLNNYVDTDGPSTSHVDLYDGAYGFGVSGWTLNYVSDRYHKFYNNDGTGATTPTMTIDSELGYVGIGTADPQAGLHIKKGGYPGSFMILDTNAINLDAGLRLNENGVTKWHFYNQGSSSDKLSIENATEAVITVDQSSNVGIGTAPYSTKKLITSGNVGVIGNLSVGASFGGWAAPTDGMIVEGSAGIGVYYAPTLANTKLAVKKGTGSDLSGTALSKTLVTDAGVFNSAYFDISSNPIPVLASFGYHYGNNISLGIHAQPVLGSMPTDWTYQALTLSMDVDNSINPSNASITLYPSGSVGIGGVAGGLLYSAQGPADKLDVGGSLKMSGDLKAEGNSWGSCMWTGFQSEEQNYSDYQCPNGYFMVGIDCNDAWCDKIDSHCCKL